ncbi:type VII secretion target [Actinokineospora auranticolor]|uniref:Excreted virulence factor EspC (Type VII ESX diderm) n=1 Tax=Actinokineospora auranticolor TaxID=155976 RepID=A0A2S6GDI3_9PSEU|nr:type VII secretion target [Actinokineospora auranticolor]PPK63297.1 excreted virulence factor EspC (type VII ESX diderm) [Actinokineospora auranticolor]
MGDGFHVGVQQLRVHAANVEAVHARFAAVRAASSHISGDNQAYGLLCGWISGVLEGKHREADELVSGVESNLELVARALRDCADEYEATEDTNSLMIRSADGEGLR